MIINIPDCNNCAPVPLLPDHFRYQILFNGSMTIIKPRIAVI